MVRANGGVPTAHSFPWKAANSVTAERASLGGQAGGPAALAQAAGIHDPANASMLAEWRRAGGRTTALVQAERSVVAYLQGQLEANPVAHAASARHGLCWICEVRSRRGRVEELAERGEARHARLLPTVAHLDADRCGDVCSAGLRGRCWRWRELVGMQVRRCVEAVKC